MPDINNKEPTTLQPKQEPEPAKQHPPSSTAPPAAEESPVPELGEHDYKTLREAIWHRFHGKNKPGRNR
jgi:hypothetical protein